MRPGVATTISTPFWSALTWRLHRWRRRRWPTTVVPRALPRGASSSCTWTAELTGGHEDEGAGAAGLGGLDPLEHREPEGEGLARAGLGLAAHVAAGEGVGDGQRLHGEGRRAPHRLERGDEVGRNAQVGERLHCGPQGFRGVVRRPTAGVPAPVARRPHSAPQDGRSAATSCGQPTGSPPGPGDTPSGPAPDHRRDSGMRSAPLEVQNACQNRGRGRGERPAGQAGRVASMAATSSSASGSTVGRKRPTTSPPGRHEELLEVPLDVAGLAVGVGGGGQLGVERMAVVAVDLDLLGQREGHAVGGRAERLRSPRRCPAPGP